MKGRITILLTALCLLCGCAKEEIDSAYTDSSISMKQYTAIVTVKESPAGTVYFQLDDDSVLYPDNYQEPFTGMQRIICGISMLQGSNECHVQWMDFLEKGDISYTQDAMDDGLDILDDWMTSVEDGFLTIHYDAWWGDGSVPHLLLVKPSADEYELTVVHRMNGDEPLEKADALIYFDINNILPDTEGLYKDLTIKWKSIEGAAKTKTFSFRSRQP